MADNRLELELLFFDTFSHENTEELNLDLVQFPRPVVIREVRVIPLQTRVLADVPGGVRLGATNPSSFKLELFVNNLSKPNAATFEKLGILDYRENVEIQINTEYQIPTDGLILKGWYNTITVAIYGVLTNVSVEPESPPPPPPPQPRTKAVEQRPAPVPQTVQSHAQPQRVPEWEQPPQQMVPVPVTTQHPLDYIQQQLQQQLIKVMNPMSSGSVQLTTQQQPSQLQQQQKQQQQLQQQQMQQQQQLQQQQLQQLQQQQQQQQQTKPLPQGHMGEMFHPVSGEAYPQQVMTGQQVPVLDHSLIGQQAREYIASPGGQEGTRDPGVLSHFSPRPRETSRERERGGLSEGKEPTRDSYDWGFQDPSRRHGSPERLVEGRDYPASREGSHEPPRERGYRDSSQEPRDRGYHEGSKDSKEFREREREKDRDRDQDSRRNRDKDTERNYERERDRGFEKEGKDLDRDQEYSGRGRRDRDFDRDRDRGRERDYDRSRDRGYDRDREYERDSERDKEYDKYSSRDRGSLESIDREREFRDRPRSPLWARSRSSSNSRERSRSRSWSPRWRRSRSKSHSESRASSKSRHSLPKSVPRQRSRSKSLPPSPVNIRSRSRSRSWSPRRGDPPRRIGSPVRIISPTAELQRRKETIPEPMSPSPEDSTEPGELNEREVLFEPLSPDAQSPAEPVYMSDGEIQDGEDAGYEEISSDDEFEMEATDLVEDFDIEEDSWSYGATSFNPYQCFLSPLASFPDVSQTEFQQEKTKTLADDVKLERPVEAEKLLAIISEFSRADHHERWVEALEGVPALLPKGLPYILYTENKQAVLDTLMDWLIEALDEDKAISQPETAYKIRHLKMGFRLAGALCVCDENIAIQVLSKNVQGILMGHFQSLYMSFSLKLQIILALDQTTRLRGGIQWFLGVHPKQGQSEKTEVKRSKFSCYQRCLQSMMQKQVVRVVVAMTNLIRKIHTFEMMNKLTQIVDSSVVSGLSDDMIGQVIGKSGDCADPEDDDLDLASRVPQVSENDVDSIITCLEEVTKVFCLAPTLIAQPGRTLPGNKMFDQKPSSRDPYPNFFHMANSSHLLESLFVLVSSPSTTSVPSLFGAVRTLLQKMVSTQHGLLYLTSKYETTNGIIRCLIQMADYNREDVTEENATQQLGIELIFYLQTLQFVDQLLAYHSKVADDKTSDDFVDQDIVVVLQNLYCMTFTPQGRDAVVWVLGLSDNLRSVLPFVEPTGNNMEDLKMKKSASAGYAAELLSVVVQYSDNVPMLQKFSTRMLAIGAIEYNSKMNQLQDWLAPFKRLSQPLSHDSLTPIVELLKNNINEVTKLPRSLITTIRIMKHLAIPPPNEYPEDKTEELKYKYVLIELFSAECFPLFVSCLQKLSDSMMRPWQNGIPLTCENLSLYLAVIRPSLEIIRTMLQHLISTRGTEFQDLTALPTLFSLHTVLCSIPTTPFFTTEISQVQKDIVDTLAAYTQPILEDKNSLESLSSSLWTRMIQELLKYTNSSPFCYLSGLKILSELLPLPLPLQTKEPLGKDEEVTVVTVRKLWSVHLLSLHDQIYRLIHTLITSSCHPLQQILRKICWQLSDLAAPTSVMITKCIMDILLENMEVIGKGDNPESEDQKVAVATRSRFLNLLAYVLSQPAIKCTMLHLISSQGEEKYSDVLNKLLEILNHVSDAARHITDQECVVSILQSLFDMEVTLISGESTVNVQEQLVNALPNTEQLGYIISALLEHIALPSHKYDTVLPCIRALVMLTEHDYSFYCLKMALENNKMAFYRLLQRIKTTFSKDSSDCFSTFSTTLVFLRLLVSTEPVDEEEISVTRTLTLTSRELQDVVAWKDDLTNHPLVSLQKILEEGSADEESLESLVDSLNGLIKVLRDEEGEESATPQDVQPPVLPDPVNLQTLFNQRSTYVITDSDDERICCTFWQTTLMSDEADLPDMVQMNIEEMCQRYCHDFSLEEELKKAIGIPVEEDMTKPRRPRDRRRSQEFVTFRGRGMRRPFVAPMRGRGIARGLAAAANRHDPFRSRPPNTSRPPSMHVDDFMKLEKDRSDSPEPSGASRRNEKEFVPHNRGRGGFDRGRGNFQNRGRFFTPPGNFSQRDGNMTRGNQGSGDNSGTMQYGGRSKPAFLSPRPFNRGGHDSRPMSAERRGGRERFQQRGGSRGNWTNPRFKDDRFQNQGSNFGRRDQGRHVRSFTK